MPALTSTYRQYISHSSELNASFRLLTPYLKGKARRRGRRNKHDEKETTSHGKGNLYISATHTYEEKESQRTSLDIHTL